MQLTELNVIALLNEIPAEHLGKGTIGTIVHDYHNGFFEVEFSDTKGRTYAQLTLAADNLLLLKHEPELAT